ncbi:MAG TPA: hypothetical protein VGI89_00875 [Rhizomicrobium sp.]
MKPLIAGILALASAASLCGCAARTVVPVQMAQAGDEALDCAALGREIAENEKAAAIFIKQDKRVEQANTAKNVGGAIPGLGLFLVLSTDLSNEEQIKARALIDRDERLRFLAKRKGCIS